MEELTAWMLALDERRAETVLPVPGGVAVLHSRFPKAHDHNKLVITTECSAEDLATAADDVLREHSHRRIEVLSPAIAATVTTGLEARGYARENGLLMELTGMGSPAEIVEAIGLGERASVASAEWRRDQPTWDDEVVRQLGDRISTAAEELYRKLGLPTG